MTVAVAGAVHEIRDRVLAARGERRVLRIAGAGTWLDAGRPVRDADMLSTAVLNGIVEYVPGDLTITVGAGVRLADLREVTAAHRQRLTLDPWGGDAGTIGATVATATAGPLATGFGTPRDLLLGIEMVTGAGAIVRGGGRVVKNVAGFDLPRLVTGSWGTLGIVTEVTLRLRGMPQADVTVSVRGRFDAAAVRARCAAFPSTPVALELVGGESSDPAEQELLVRLQGNAEAVASQRAAIAALGNPREVAETVWQSARTLDAGGASVWRLSASPARVNEAVRVAQEITKLCPGARWHASLLRGVVRCIVPAGTPGPALDAALSLPFAGTRVCERLSAGGWRAVPPTAADSLSRGIARAFDPDGVLNAGILGGAR